MTETKRDLYQTNWARMILAGLQSKNIYLGTVEPEVVRIRRAKNKVARGQHKRNRQRNG